MKYYLLNSFERTFQRLSIQEREKTKKAILKLVDFFETGLKPSGLGLKKLTRFLWEIRVDQRIRVLFRFEGKRVEFGLVGTHQMVCRYLRHY